MLPKEQGTKLELSRRARVMARDTEMESHTHTHTVSKTERKDSRLREHVALYAESA